MVDTLGMQPKHWSVCSKKKRARGLEEQLTGHLREQNANRVTSFGFSSLKMILCINK